MDVQEENPTREQICDLKCGCFRICSRSRIPNYCPADSHAAATSLYAAVVRTWVSSSEADHSCHFSTRLDQVPAKDIYQTKDHALHIPPYSRLCHTILLLHLASPASSSKAYPDPELLHRARGSQTSVAKPRRKDSDGAH